MRRVRPVIYVLLLGLVINIAVAWICALSSTPSVADAVHAQTGWGHNRFLMTGVARDLFCGECQKRMASWRKPDRSGQPAQRTTVDLAGWPLRSLSCQRVRGPATPKPRSSVPPDSEAKIVGGIELATPDATSWRALPFEPVWPGFFRNTIFYAAIAGPMMLVPRVVRRSRRRRQGCCVSCGYPRGDSPACPECGLATGDQRSGAPNRARSRGWRSLLVGAGLLIAGSAVVSATGRWDVVLLGGPIRLDAFDAADASIELPPSLTAAQISAMTRKEVTNALVAVAKAKNRLGAEWPCQQHRLSNEFSMLMKRRRSM